MVTLAERKQHNLLVLTGSLPSSDPSSYRIDPRDYKRNNSDERHYRAKWLLKLLRLYDCRCALCGADQDGYELDHFWLPKAKGGNFILRADHGKKLINNAAPLCVHCNRAKGEKTMALTPEQSVRIADVNRRMTAAINDELVEYPADMRGYEHGDEHRVSELGNELWTRELKRAMRAHQRTRTQESESVLRDAVDRYLTGRV